MIPIVDRPRLYLDKNVFEGIVYHSLTLPALADITSSTIHSRRGPLLWNTDPKKYRQGLAEQFGEEEDQRRGLARIANYVFMGYNGGLGFTATRFLWNEPNTKKVPEYRRKVVEALNTANRDLVEDVEERGLRYFWEGMQAGDDREGAYRRLWALLSAESELYQALSAGLSFRLRMLKSFEGVGNVIGLVNKSIGQGVVKLAEEADYLSAAVLFSMDKTERRLRRKGWKQKDIEEWKKRVYVSAVTAMGNEYQDWREVEGKYAEAKERVRILGGEVDARDRALTGAENHVEDLQRIKEELEGEVEGLRGRPTTDQIEGLVEENRDLSDSVTKLTRRLGETERERDQALEVGLNEAGRLYKAIKDIERRYNAVEGDDFDIAVLGKAPELLTRLGAPQTRENLVQAAAVFLPDREQGNIEFNLQRYVESGALVADNGSLHIPKHVGRVSDKGLRNLVRALQS